jgi:hypothetical protein
MRPPMPVGPDSRRRPNVAPTPSPIAQRRGTLPPLAQPAPRGAMGLGVSDPSPRPGTPPGGRATGPAPAYETFSSPDAEATGAATTVALNARSSPAPQDAGRRATAAPTPQPTNPPTGQMPLVDWSSAATVTPATATPYPIGSGDYNALASVRTNIPDLRTRKLVLLAGAVLAISLVVLGIALVWPDGPARGSIEVLSSPPGATVRIDGTVLSKLTPIRISDVDVRQPHRIAVTLRGYDTWETDAKFDSGERDIRLQAALISSVGTLEISTTPPGAEAIVNGRYSGVTPTKVGDLPPNDNVVLELKLRGYKVVYTTLKWNGKRAMSVTIPLEKAR